MIGYSFEKIICTKHENDAWHKEVNTKLKVAKQETDALKQDVNQRYQEARDSFTRLVLANARMFAEVDRQIADLWKQRSVRASNTVYNRIVLLYRSNEDAAACTWHMHPANLVPVTERA